MLSLGERRRSSSEMNRLVMPSKRWWSPRVGRRLIEVPKLVRASVRRMVSTSGRERASVQV